MKILLDAVMINSIIRAWVNDKLAQEEMRISRYEWTDTNLEIDLEKSNESDNENDNRFDGGA
jgi:hypothetical protein